jgi:hypothetical protein
MENAAMPGPFPGMDPFLENTIRWRGFHGALISEICYALNRLLPQGFVANAEERCYIQSFEQMAYPDAVILRERAPDMARTEAHARLAVLERPPLVFEEASQEVSEGFVEITTVGDENEVVAVVEVLSPANKASGSEGRNEYIRKQTSLLESETHLLEIDLLRAGAHTVAMGRGPIATERAVFDYLVCLHRAGRDRRRFEVWPFTVRERLPEVLIPLTVGLPDVVLDLQPLFDRIYEGFQYRQILKYRREPEPPLSPADTVWADALLREKGLRLTV